MSICLSLILNSPFSNLQATQAIQHWEVGKKKSIKRKKFDFYKKKKKIGFVGAAYSDTIIIDSSIENLFINFTSAGNCGGNLGILFITKKS